MNLKFNSFILACILIQTIQPNLQGQPVGDGTKIRIDSHIHLYDTNREGSATFLDPKKNEKIYFPHLAPEFLKVAAPSGVNYAIVIEASKRREDNFWAMNVVNESTNMLAFIANLDPRDSTFVTDLKKLTENKKFRGIRIRPLTKIDLSDQSIIDKLGEIAKRKLALELGPNEEPLEAIEIIARKYPGMNIIIFDRNKLLEEKEFSMEVTGHFRNCLVPIQIWFEFMTSIWRKIRLLPPNNSIGKML